MGARQTSRQDTRHDRPEHVYRGTPILGMGDGPPVRGWVASGDVMERSHARRRRVVVREEPAARTGNGAVRAVLPPQPPPSHAPAKRRAGRHRIHRSDGFSLATAADTGTRAGDLTALGCMLETAQSNN